MEPQADGTMAVPDGPGIGIDLDPARLAPWITETWRLDAA
jgi:D-galactarolactone cycloisomerase